MSANHQDQTITPTTSTDEQCLTCEAAKDIRWTTSTPSTDTWTCRSCGTEWTITVDAPQEL